MQSIERYGVVALLFLIVTVAAVLMWGDGNQPEEPTRGAGPLTRPEAGSAVHASLNASREGPRAVTDERARQRELRAAAEEPHLADRYGTPSTPAELERARGGLVPGGTGDARLGSEVAALDGFGSGTRPVQDDASARREREDELRREAEQAAEDARRADEAARAAARLAALDEQLERAEAPAPRGGVPVYEVRSGDVLGVVAQRELGSVKRMAEIIDLNPGLNPDKIRAGLKLRMPPDWAGAAGAPTVAAAPALQPTRDVPAGMRTYVVQEGESLWTIAQRQLGNGGRYREIEAANPGVAGSKIVPGQELLLPGTELALAEPPRPERTREASAGTSSGRKVR